MTLVSNWLGPPGAARVNCVLAPLYWSELAVLIKDRVGPQVGLQNVGSRHRDLEGLRAKVEASLKSNVDGLISVIPSGGPSSSWVGNFQRPVEWSRCRQKLARVEATKSAFASRQVLRQRRASKPSWGCPWASILRDGLREFRRPLASSETSPLPAPGDCPEERTVRPRKRWYGIVDRRALRRRPTSQHRQDEGERSSPQVV